MVEHSLSMRGARGSIPRISIIIDERNKEERIEKGEQRKRKRNNKGRENKNRLKRKEEGKKEKRGGKEESMFFKQRDRTDKKR